MASSDFPQRQFLVFEWGGQTDSPAHGKSAWTPPACPLWLSDGQWCCRVAFVACNILIKHRQSEIMRKPCKKGEQKWKRKKHEQLHFFCLLYSTYALKHLFRLVVSMAGSSIITPKASIIQRVRCSEPWLQSKKQQSWITTYNNNYCCCLFPYTTYCSRDKVLGDSQAAASL